MVLSGGLYCIWFHPVPKGPKCKIAVLYLIERMFRNTLGGKDLKNKIGVIEAETPTVPESGITNLDFADDFAVL